MRDGGHDVPVEKVMDRRRRSFEELGWFARNVDRLFVFDNSVGDPDLIAEKAGDALFCWEELPRDMHRVLIDAGLRLSVDIADLE